MIVRNGDEELEHEISVDEMLLEHVSENQYLGYVLDESVTDEAEGRRK